MWNLVVQKCSVLGRTDVIERGAVSVEQHVHKNNIDVGDRHTCVDISLLEVSDVASVIMLSISRQPVGMATMTCICLIPTKDA